MSKAFSLGLFGIFLIYGGLQLMQTYAVIYAVSIGLSVGFASYTLSAVAAFAILGSMLSAITARVGHFIGTQIGVAFSIAGLVLLLTLHASPLMAALYVVALSLTAFGWNYGLTFVLASTAAADRSGSAAALGYGVTNMGGALVPIAIGPVIDHLGLKGVPMSAALLVLVGGLAIIPLTRLQAKPRRGAGSRIANGNGV
jgi:predicted MFS family arabinose efflux permease